MSANKIDLPLGEILKLDREANSKSLKGRWIVVAFRWAWWLRRGNSWLFYLSIPYLIVYRVIVEWFLGVELPPLTEVGPGLSIHHGQGMVVNNESKIGSFCTLRHGVTIGNSKEGGGSPHLGDHVEVGANALILGEISIGDGAKVGAGAVVTKDVAANAVVVGNPAQEIH